jgi:hypothetical protein
VYIVASVGYFVLQRFGFSIAFQPYVAGAFMIPCPSVLAIRRHAEHRA